MEVPLAQSPEEVGGEHVIIFPASGWQKQLLLQICSHPPQRLNLLGKIWIPFSWMWFVGSLAMIGIQAELFCAPVYVWGMEGRWTNLHGLWQINTKAVQGQVSRCWLPGQRIYHIRDFLKSLYFSFEAIVSLQNIYKLDLNKKPFLKLPGWKWIDFFSIQKY